MTYEEAINLVKQGNEYGFQYLYDTTYRTCLYAIGEIVKDSMEAEDILQDAYMNAIKKIDSLKDPEKFPSWFRTMASRLAINRVNKNKKTQTVNPGEDETPESVMDRMVNEKLGSGQITPEEAYETKEISGLLHEIIDELPEKQRQCILLFYMEEYSIKDIAEACKCNENTVKSRLNYGKQKLEEKTLELQQKGYVLWGVSPVYLITWLLRSDMANKLKFVYSNTQTLEYMNSIFYSLVNAGIIESTAGMSTITGGVSDGVSSGMVNGGVSNSAVTGGVSNGAVTGGVSNVVKGGVTKGSAAAIKGGIHTVAGKIAAGVVAAAITGRLITTGVIINNNNKNDNEIVAEVTEAASEEASTTEVITTEEVTEAATTEVASEEDLISDTIISGDINELNIF